MNIMHSLTLPDEIDMTRDEAEHAIGDFLESSEGRQALLKVVEELSFSALSDEALVELAIRHWKEQHRVLGD